MEFSDIFEKKFGFGYLRLPHINPDDISDVDTEEVNRMADLFLEKGFRYFDTAYTYLDYKSEIFFRETVVKRHPRESFSITTKLPCSILKSGDVPEKIFNEQLEKCGVDYFDVYLLHGIDASRLPVIDELDCFGFLKKIREAGKARFIGFSFHDTADVLDSILTAHPEVDVVQIQLNYLDWDHDIIQSKACYDVCRKHNKPILVMEPVKGGTLAKLPKEAENLLRAYNPDRSPSSWALRFAASQPGVAMVLSGMSNLSQVEENTEDMEIFEPLSSEELALLDRVREIVRAAVAVPCTACSYCTEGCPMQIPIPRYFALYNELKRDGWQANTKKRYAEMSLSHSKASACIECRHCESKCPQHLTITSYLKNVAEAFEA